MEEVVKGLGVSRTSKTHLHPQSNTTVELHVMTMGGHLSQMASTHQRNWVRVHTTCCWPTEHRPKRQKAWVPSSWC